MNIPFSKVTLGEEEVEAVNKVLRSGWLAAGPETEAFEKEFAEYISWWEEDPYSQVKVKQTPYCIFTTSCTAALKMAYKYYQEKGYKHYKLLEPNTFCATYAAAEEMGLTPGDFKTVRVSMHYGGVKQEIPCEIEDSAHRIEPNDPLIGKIRVYSFYATKNMTTSSGGMFVTNDKEIYEKARLYWRDGLTSSTHDRQTGKSWDYDVATMAGGYDGDDLRAAIGRIQIRKLPDFTRRRNEIRDKYNQAFGQHWMGNHLYPYFVDSLDAVPECIKYLKEKGIGVGYHYPKTGWKGISLPIYPLLTDEEQDYIIKTIKEYEILGSS